MDGVRVQTVRSARRVSRLFAADGILIVGQTYTVELTTPHVMQLLLTLTRCAPLTVSLLNGGGRTRSIVCTTPTACMPASVHSLREVDAPT
jgi:hypothetical protein